MGEELRSFELRLELDTNKQTYNAAWTIATADLEDLPRVLHEWLVGGDWIDGDLTVIRDDSGREIIASSPGTGAAWLKSLREQVAVDETLEQAYSRGWQAGREYEREVMDPEPPPPPTQWELFKAAMKRWWWS